MLYPFYPVHGEHRGWSLDVAALALARIRKSHYFVNKMFLPDAYFFENLYKIRHIPRRFRTGTIRHDMSYGDGGCIGPCLRRRPNITSSNDAGHSAMEPGVQSALVAATEQFRLAFNGVKIRLGRHKALHPFSAHLE